ncbi:protein LIM1 [Juglans microcarpa x Juglans regia]|uniref:protein LIM1 n=1 Tax=Juglans microcarpa x Juglans regia TaxID=2249226 RepID=UPI001B7EB4A8|nr:protein LIM1 [Juglans microcarpa x Juglans regia]
MTHFGTKVLPPLVLMLVMTISLMEPGKAAASCPSTFFSALVQLIPCRAAVAPFSPLPPSDACCNALKALGQPCLCVLVNGPQSLVWTGTWLCNSPRSAPPTLNHAKS